MDNYIMTARICEEEFHGFVKKITAGMGKIETKFCAQMIAGINKSASVILTNIARNSIKGVSVKKSAERLSRHLNSFDSGRMWGNYCGEVGNLFGENPLYIVDDTEAVKPLSERMEGLDWVRDGSDNDKLKPGYSVNEIVAINKKGQPVSVSSKLYTATEQEFESANTIRCEAVKEVVKNNGSGTFVCDRGFDDVKFFNFLSKIHQKYIIRCKSNRNVIDNGKAINIYEAAKGLKGKYSFSIKFQSGKKENLKASYIQVQLPKMSAPLTLVAAFGFHNDEDEPFFLLTNHTVQDKDSCLNVIRAYLSRWKIEEYFKFKKQAYGFEAMRLLKLAALKNLNTFLTVVLGFMATLSLSSICKKIIQLSEPIKAKAAFIYYRLYNGFHTFLHCFKSDLLLFIYPKKPKPPQPQQRDLFHYLRYQKNRQNLRQFQNGGF